MLFWERGGVVRAKRVGKGVEEGQPLLCVGESGMATPCLTFAAAGAHGVHSRCRYQQEPQCRPHPVP